VEAAGADVAAVASVAPGEVASADTLRVVGAVVAGAGPGALQALLFSGFGRRLGYHTMAAPTSSTAITVRAGQYRRRR
jgi:hypothetical protein